MKFCPKCNKNHINNGRFCSRTCANDRSGIELKLKKIACSCGNVFYGKKATINSKCNSCKYPQRVCKKCNTNFTSKKGLIHYCSLQCRNSRTFSQESRNKKSQSNILFNKLYPENKIKQAERLKTSGTLGNLIAASKMKTLISIENYEKSKPVCKICLTQLTYIRRHNVTCGNKECVVRSIQENRKYHNGKRKTFHYDNKLQGKVVLESTWEWAVAEYLDKLNIVWTRPNPIKWTDYKGIGKLYYPDFYLNDYDLYLDPKNPYCLVLDKDKIEIVSKDINLKVGNVNEIILFIDSLVIP